jgi:hypothetical protein
MISLANVNAGDNFHCIKRDTMNICDVRSAGSATSVMPIHQSPSGEAMRNCGQSRLDCAGSIAAPAANSTHDFAKISWCVR